LKKEHQNVNYPSILSAGLLIVIFFQGCARSPLAYQAATSEGAGTSNAYLSNGYTSEKIIRSVDYSGKAEGDEIHFVTFGSELSRVPMDHQKLLAIYRSTELALINKFKCLAIYPENKFENKSRLLKGSNTWNLTGSISATGSISGTVSQSGGLEVNLDRHWPGPEARWGSGVYVLLSNSCSSVVPGPAVFSLPSSAGRPNNLSLTTEVRYLPSDLQNELKTYLRAYLQ
jgi:hypothetical protein